MLPGNLSLSSRGRGAPSQSFKSHQRKRRIFAALFVVGASMLSAASNSAAATDSRQLARQLPLSFEENRGQTDKAFGYLLRYDGAEVRFAPGEVDFNELESKGMSGAIRMRMQGAGVTPQGEQLLDGQSNYLIGSDASKWTRHVPHFRRVAYDQVYPGISLAFYGNGDALEHDFELEPGADPSRIIFRFDGAHGVAISARGDLEIRGVSGAMTLRKPVAYQISGTDRTSVDAAFVLDSSGSVSFSLGAYDHMRSLVIDPVFVFSTYLGGTNADQAQAVTTDASGNIYLTGYTYSTDFPTENPVQPHSGCAGNSGCQNVFITKLNPSGTALIYSTYLGGSDNDIGSSIAVDASGNAVVSGFATSQDFPHAGGLTPHPCSINDTCYFVASIKPDGSALNYAGTIGGIGALFGQDGNSVAVDSAGNAYLTGATDDPNFQITAGTLTTSVEGYPYAELFILKVDPTGKLVYSTVVPGTATPDVTTINNQFLPAGITVDASGQATVAGTAGLGLPTTAGVIQKTFPESTNAVTYSAGYVLQVNATASAINFASYLPGTFTANAIATNSAGDLYFTGVTDQTNLPVSSNAYQKVPVISASDGGEVDSGYILELSPKATGVVAATYLNGTGTTEYESSEFFRIGLDSKGDIFVGGQTSAADFPLQDPFTTVQMTTLSVNDMVLAAVSPDMSKLVFGSFLDAQDVGSFFSGMAIDGSDKLIVAGTSRSLNFPTTAGSFQPSPPTAQPPTSHMFIARIDMAAPAPSACLSSISFDFGSVSAGKSAMQTLNVKNCGNGPLTLSSIVSSDPTVAPTQSCGAIAPGGLCPITLTFTPVIDAQVTGTLTIMDNAVLPPPVVSFTGIGQAPKIYVQPQALIFPAQVLGIVTSGTSMLVTVANGGAPSLVIDNAHTTVTGSFSIVSDSCTAPLLLNNNNCTIGISFNPTQSGAVSGSLNIASNDPGNPILTVPLSGTALATYPVPTITAILNPSYPISTGSTPISATVVGTNFFPSSIVYVNGAAQATTYQHPTQLDFKLDSSVLKSVGEIPVTVVNPAPGGGVSAPYPLLAYLSVPLQSTSLVVDPVGGLLYAAIPADAPANASTIIPINPATGAMMKAIAVSSDPQLLAVSDDGSELYVATSKGVLQRINLKTLKIEKTFSLPVDPNFGQTTAHEMHVVPGAPQSIVVELFANVDPAEDGAALYNASGLVDWVPGEGTNARNFLQLDSFTFTSPTTIYGLPESNSFFAEVQVSPTALSIVSPTATSCCDRTIGSLISSDGTLLYTSSGEVWDPRTQKLVGTYLAESGTLPLDGGRPIPEAANKHTYLLDSATGYFGNSALDIDIYDQVTYALDGTIAFVGRFQGAPSDLVRWGTNGFAFRVYDYSGDTPSADQIVILTSSKVTTSAGAPVPIVSSVSPGSAYAGGPAYTLQINGTGFTAASTVIVDGTLHKATFVSEALLTVQILASDIATASQLELEVVTPTPGGGISNEVQIPVNRQTPQLTITPPSFSVTTAQAISVTVTVSGGKGYPVATGSVALSDINIALPAVALSGGSATLTIPPGTLGAGKDTFTASFTPDAADAFYLGVTGTSEVTVVTPGAAKASVTVTPSVETATDARSVVVQVTVAGTSGAAAPTGSVTLSSGSYSAQSALASGSAGFTVPAGALADGSDVLTASYAGDAIYASASATATVTITQVEIAGPAPAPVSPGGSATTKVTLAAGSNYSGTVTLACALTASPANAVSQPTCTLNPASVSLAPGGSAATTMTVATTAASGSAMIRWLGPDPAGRGLSGLGVGAAALAGVFLFMLPRRCRGLWLACLMGLAIASWTAACGGGGSGTAPPKGPAVSATTAGSYTFTVTATDAASSKVAASTTVTVTVQ